LATTTFFIPDNAVDGVYTHEVSDSTGEITLWYHGTLDNTADPVKVEFEHPPVDGALLTPLAKKLETRAAIGPYCTSGGSSSDYGTVSSKMVQRCGAGYSWRTTISILSNSVVSYGCDYGNGQTCQAGNVYGMYSQIDARCGTQGAGWFLEKRLEGVLQTYLSRKRILLGLADPELFLDAKSLRFYVLVNIARNNWTVKLNFTVKANESMAKMTPRS
jgi:hypothetical protein